MDHYLEHMEWECWYFLTFSVLFLETLNYSTLGIFSEKSIAPIFTNKVSYER